MKIANKHFLSTSSIISIIILISIICITVFAPALAPYDPLEINMTNRLAAPSSDHFLGTDTLGRDVFSRVLYGGRASIVLALIATIATMVIGLAVGTLAGYFGGWIDDLIHAITNMFQGLPGMSFMLAIAGVLGPSINSLLIAIIITSWADFSRIVRGEVLKIREEPYIEGIRALGGCHSYVIFAYIIPNMIGPLVVLFTVRIGRVVLAIAALSFLGLGLQPPIPDWGVMVNDARPHFRSNPQLIIAPGLCILFLSVSINLLGDSLRDFFDAKMDSNVKQFI